ncbi:MAG: DPP IV N-terminal domain-containing protein, partial [marine benthic group bacterium]|nr:DPP IV N-terminal domain-containing protein [Gemmatimonadota bacterium]
MLGRIGLGVTLLMLIPSYVIAQEPRPPVNLTDHPADDRYPSWSPAGGALAFESNRDGNWNLYLMDPRTGNVTQLTDHPADDRFPGWDPIGQTLVFFSDRDGRPALYTLALLTGEL